KRQHSRRLGRCFTLRAIDFRTFRPPTLVPPSWPIPVICTVGAFRDELLLVTIVAEPLGFLPSVGYGCCGFCIYPITTPQLPVFAVRVNYVEHCHFDRAHSFASMGKTSYALEPMMRTVLIFLDKIVA